MRLRSNTRNFAKTDYLEAYADRTNLLVDIDPRMAIGGIWNEMGEKQFEFMKMRGLEPHHSLLDIGCGTLRGGQHFIRYLEPDKYSGFDISVKAIEAASEAVRDLGLSGRRPKLRVNTARNLRFSEYQGNQFDFLLAQSVFSHLKPEHIRECFENIGSIMHDDSHFFFTYHPGDSYRVRSHTDFEYPMEFFGDLGREFGFDLEDLSDEYQHTRGQRMIRMTKVPEHP